MSTPPIITPRQTKLERLRSWVRGWSPQVKQGTIAALVLVIVTVTGWLLIPKSKSQYSIGKISGGNNQFGDSNTMVINPDVTNALRRIDEDHDLVRSIEAVFTYDIALDWTKRGPKSSVTGIVGNPLLTLISTSDTNRPPIRFVSTSETTEVIQGLGLRGRYELKLATFAKALRLQDLTNYDDVVSSLKLINFEDNVAGDVTLRKVQLQMLVNSASKYDASATSSAAMKLSNLAGGMTISFRVSPFAPERRVKW